MVSQKRDLVAAVETIADGTEIHAVTDGDVSYHELAAAAARAAGHGCQLSVATSAANEEPCHELVRLADAGEFSLRVVACFAALRMNGPRGKAVERVLAGRLGLARTHAKFSVAVLGNRKVSVLTTANLNVNKRTEAHFITTDPEVADHMLGVLAEFSKLGDAPGKGGAYYNRAFMVAMRRKGDSEINLRVLAERWSE